MPTTCLRRCQKRCRDEEKCIGIDFLENIHQRHEEWLFGKKSFNDIPILVIDCDQGEILNQIFLMTKKDKKKLSKMFKTLLTMLT